MALRISEIIAEEIGRDKCPVDEQVRSFKSLADEFTEGLLSA